MNLRPWFAQGLTPSALGLASNLFGRSLQMARRDHSHPTTPASDNATDFATSALRWAKGYFARLHFGAGATFLTSGTGSPEGVLTAPVGTFYTRTDGGAGTTLYVKESGTGNTGWVAK